MKRKTFLKSLVALALLPFLPRVQTTERKFEIFQRWIDSSGRVMAEWGRMIVYRNGEETEQVFYTFDGRQYSYACNGKMLSVEEVRQIIGWSPLHSTSQA